MTRPWIATLAIVSNLFMNVADGQQPGQVAAPTTTASTESEVSTRSAETIKAQVNLVLVPVVVRDARGKPVPGLRREDFQVWDNGKLQKISAFSVETAETAGKSGAATAEGRVARTDTGHSSRSKRAVMGGAEGVTTQNNDTKWPEPPKQVLQVVGNMVELVGIEPTTSSLRTMRSPS
jgi:hypothetical protein